MREIREVIVYCGIIISNSHGRVYTPVKKESDNESRFIVINFHLLPLLENTRLYRYHTFSKFNLFKRGLSQSSLSLWLHIISSLLRSKMILRHHYILF